MPIHEYRCRQCGGEFEEITLSASADAAVSCSHCGSRRVTRLLSAFAVHGNGSSESVAMESGGCGACGAPRRGMCGE